MCSLDLDIITSRTITLFLLVDKSGSMQGNKIATVNDTIRNIIPALQEITAQTPATDIKIAALEFASDSHWMYPEPQSVHNFQWQNIRADGWTALGEACLELNDKLSSHGFMPADSTSHSPIIILISDGAPSDNFSDSIAVLKHNLWFNNAIRIAIAIGNDANYDVLSEFTGKPQAIYEAYNTDALKNIIRIATLSASQIGCQSTIAESPNIQDQVIQSINQQLELHKTSETEDW